jgi:hypothetical protein
MKVKELLKVTEEVQHVLHKHKEAEDGDDTKFSDPFVALKYAGGTCLATALCVNAIGEGLSLVRQSYRKNNGKVGKHYFCTSPSGLIIIDRYWSLVRLYTPEMHFEHWSSFLREPTNSDLKNCGPDLLRELNRAEETRVEASIGHKSDQNILRLTKVDPTDALRDVTDDDSVTMEDLRHEIHTYL